MISVILLLFPLSALHVKIIAGHEPNDSQELIYTNRYVFYLKQRILHILFWSVISAAFIGPGTVTTAASAGTGFGYSLIWALVFSTAACFVLQEASARITAVSGLNLGEAMRREYSGSAAGKWLIFLALAAILSGCAAFEAGNILGAVAGIHILSGAIPDAAVVLAIGFLSAFLLWKGTIRQIATLLGLIVAVMGICFVATALLVPHSAGSIFAGFSPAIPSGAEILVLGLIGTTVVPYNIFLGSGLKHTQTPSEMKLSLIIAIGLGGFVSIAILLTGTAISGDFTFEALAEALAARLGNGAHWLLGIGLFGAGLSSTLTAALAAAITAKSLLARPETSENWQETGIRFRSVWAGVLAVGLIFGLLQLRPVPVIILAQALNGIILPVIAVILFLLMNNERVLPAAYQNGRLYNMAMAAIVYLTVLIGSTNVLQVLSRISGINFLNGTTIIVISLALFIIFLIPAAKKFFNKKP